MTKALIVLVNYKRPLETIACLQSLSKLNFANHDIALCDNYSNDGSADTLKKFFDSNYGLVRQWSVPDGAGQCFCYADTKHVANSLGKLFLYLSPRNDGFAAGNNAAYKIVPHPSKYDYVWFLNNDTEVEPDALKAMVERMQASPEIGICGSTLIYAYDRVSVQVLGGCAYSAWTGSIKEIGNRTQWPIRVVDSEVEQQLDYVSGASMLVSSAFIREVGLMTEDYFLYFEEIDWAQRAKQKGFKLGYASGSVVFHKEGASIGTGKSESRSLLAEYYGLRNKLLITWRFFPEAFLSIYLLSWLQVIRRLINRRWANARLMAKMLLGMRGSELTSSRST